MPRRINQGSLQLKLNRRRKRRKSRGRRRHSLLRHMTRSARNPNPIVHPPPLLMARSSPAVLLLLLALAGVAAAGDIVHQDDEAPKIPGCANDFVLVYMAPVISAAFSLRVWGPISDSGSLLLVRLLDFRLLRLEVVSVTRARRTVFHERVSIDSGAPLLASCWGTALFRVC